MQTLILKLNATGDVVRTTSLLRCLQGDVTWITAERNLPLLQNLPGLPGNLCALPWEDRAAAANSGYDLVINLEDDRAQADFAASLEAGRFFGANPITGTSVGYTQDASAWFDMSLISRYGPQEADRRKLRNRRTYQEMIFEGLGFVFQGERYVLPAPTSTGLQGDVAISPLAGPVWPIKNWTGYTGLKQRLEADGLIVNTLPRRDSLPEHLGDIAGHRCLVGGDSLPMHLALGLGIPCVSIFNCTSPWEIFDYGIQRKIVSPLLEKFFYQRIYSEEAASAVTVEEVHRAVLERLSTVSPAIVHQ